MGFRAQFIFAVPEHQTVVVVTRGTQDRRDQHKPVEFLYSHILPAVRRSPPPRPEDKSTVWHGESHTLRLRVLSRGASI